MGETGADIAVVSWMFEFRPCSRIDPLPYMMAAGRPDGEIVLSP